jgi:hypothetical protein
MPWGLHIDHIILDLVSRSSYQYLRSRGGGRRCSGPAGSKPIRRCRWLRSHPACDTARLCPCPGRVSARPHCPARRSLRHLLPPCRSSYRPAAAWAGMAVYYWVYYHCTGRRRRSGKPTMAEPLPGLPATPGRGRCVSTLTSTNKNRCYIGRSQSKRPPKRTQRPPHQTRRRHQADTTTPTGRGRSLQQRRVAAADRVALASHGMATRRSAASQRNNGQAAGMRLKLLGPQICSI